MYKDITIFLKVYFRMAEITISVVSSNRDHLKKECIDAYLQLNELQIYKNGETYNTNICNECKKFNELEIGLNIKLEACVVEGYVPDVLYNEQSVNELRKRCERISECNNNGVPPVQQDLRSNSNTLNSHGKNQNEFNGHEPEKKNFSQEHHDKNTQSHSDEGKVEETTFIFNHQSGTSVERDIHTAQRSGSDEQEISTLVTRSSDSSSQTIHEGDPDLISVSQETSSETKTNYSGVHDLATGDNPHHMKSGDDSDKVNEDPHSHGPANKVSDSLSVYSQDSAPEEHRGDNSVQSITNSLGLNNVESGRIGIIIPSSSHAYGDNINTDAKGSGDATSSEIQHSDSSLSSEGALSRDTQEICAVEGTHVYPPGCSEGYYDKDRDKDPTDSHTSHNRAQEENTSENGSAHTVVMSSNENLKNSSDFSVIIDKDALREISNLGEPNGLSVTKPTGNIHSTGKGIVSDESNVDTQEIPYKKYIIMIIVPLAIILLCILLIKYTPLGTLFTKKKRKKRKVMKEKLQVLLEPSLASERRIQLAYSFSDH
ncbi:variable surface protein [Plasmodium gonderi]|uniref:Variable surface protein n=1 Tax=Plasmodium gonderi TaxID=77519 RepID=A0A1Y1JL88_PLAGO|nr:variable surface protein [Plasmodium gonderi]GAW83201.1 variable surface protein [Plasmodium gonderi]